MYASKHPIFWFDVQQQTSAWGLMKHFGCSQIRYEGFTILQVWILSKVSLKILWFESCGEVPTAAHPMWDPATTQSIFPLCSTILSNPVCLPVATGNEIKSGLGEVEQLKVQKVFLFLQMVFKAASGACCLIKQTFKVNLV